MKYHAMSDGDTYYGESRAPGNPGNLEIYKYKYSVQDKSYLRN